HLGVDVDPVNWGWLCDKGRFDFEAVNSEERLGEPLARTGDRLSEVHWADALTAAADGLRGAIDRHGAGSVAVIGGARLTNESAYAWAKLAKGVIGTDNVDCQLGDGLPAEAVLGLPRATIDEACAAGGTVLVLGVDLKEELPVLHLRLRHAVREDGVTLVELVPHGTGQSGLAAHSLVHGPGAVADVAAQLVADQPADAGGLPAATLAAAGAALRQGPVTVILGRGNLADAADLVGSAAVTLLEGLDDVRFLSGLRRGNVHGALDAGLAPGILPGRVSLDDGRAALHDHWTTVPTDRGLDTTGILTAAADGKLDVLVLLGADPLADFPDHDLARRALAGARTVVAVDTLPNPSVLQADVVLPAAGYAEVDGTTTNLEGRVSILSQKVTPPGTARADWVIAAELAYRLGDDLGLERLEDIVAEVATVAPSHTGLTLDQIGVDGVLVPLAAGGDETTDARTAAEPEGIHTEGGADMPDADVDPEAAAAGVDREAADTAEEQGAAEVEATEQQAAAEAEDAADGDAADGEEAPAPRLAAPQVPPLRYRPAAVSVPPLGGYELRLLTSRRLYDLATGTQASAQLAGLAADAEVHLHPHDFDRLGVTAGDPVTVSGRERGRGQVTVPAHPSAAVPKGAAFLRFNAPGASAAELIDAASPVTDVRVEVAR
ncbi:MAG TPA: molybdopterin-dependent oxidoreductase, partial [Acidimicrobiales bacterium]|nr:molybdopterin-dependent oxidoreductase [Acidimicrobiales bacterium]